MATGRPRVRIVTDRITKLDPIDIVTHPHGRGFRFRFGLKGLLVTVFAFGIVLGCLAIGQHQVDRQAARLAALGRLGVVPRLSEFATPGLILRKFPASAEALLRRWAGDGWFEVPSVLVGFDLQDETVPEVAERVKQLGAVREIHYAGPKLTAGGASELSRRLPGINVVPNATPSSHRYFLARTRGTHSAHAAMWVTLGAVGAALALVFLALRAVFRHVRPRRMAA